MFKQRQIDKGNKLDIDPDSMAIYLLVDESHSMMESERYLRAREGAIILAEALDKLNISFALTGYTAGGKLKRIIYKEFHEAYQEVKARLLNMTHRLGTFTSEHIPSLSGDW